MENLFGLVALTKLSIDGSCYEHVALLDNIFGLTKLEDLKLWNFNDITTLLTWMPNMF